MSYKLADDTVQQFSNYVRTVKELYLPYVAEKFNIPLSGVVNLICDLWDTFDNPHMVDNMLVLDYPQKKWYYEVCDTPYKRGKSISIDLLDEYMRRNQRTNQHISVFAHDELWKENVIQTGSPSCKGTLLYGKWFWIELDRKDYNKEASFQKAVTDAMVIKNRLGDQAIVMTSGNQSTHIVINGELFGNPIISQHNNDIFKRIAHEIAGNVRFGFGSANVYSLYPKELKEHFQKCYPNTVIADSNPDDNPNIFVWDDQIACSSTENIDPNIYNVNSLIRQPYSIHESGKHKKVVVNNKQFQYGYKPIIFPKTKPTLLKLWYDLWEQKEVKKTVDTLIESSYFVERYSQWYPDIVDMRPNEHGYVGKFHSVLYDDGNAGVDINVRTGYHKDHGSPKYSVSFDEFIMLMENK